MSIQSSTGTPGNNIQDDEEMVHLSTSEQHQQQQPSRSIVLSRYAILATIAVLLTLTCPGKTKLWIERTAMVDKNTGTTDNNSNDRWLLNRFLVIEVLVIYVMIVTGFVIVHFSNPGFLTKEIMDDIQDCENNSTGTGILVDDNEQQQFLLTTSTTMNHDKKEHRMMIEMSDLTVNDNNSNGIASKNIDQLTVLNDNETRDDPCRTLTATRRSKYCTTCQIQPLIRSHHCKVCQRCVATFDHHCYFMGVCIGERNRTKFYCFLLIQAIGFYICIHIVSSSNYGWTTILFPPKTIINDKTLIYYYSIRVTIAKLFLYPLTTIAWIMLGIHSFFVVTNITTFECAKGSKHIDYLQDIHDIMDLPFNRGFVQNIQSCCINDDICYNKHCSYIGNDKWKPTIWRKPGNIVRDSPDWWNHPWQNKYWSCC
jgi:hypothetical protein